MAREILVYKERDGDNAFHITFIYIDHNSDMIRFHDLSCSDGKIDIEGYYDSYYTPYEDHTSSLGKNHKRIC